MKININHENDIFGCKFQLNSHKMIQNEALGFQRGLMGFQGGSPWDPRWGLGTHGIPGWMPIGSQGGPLGALGLWGPIAPGGPFQWPLALWDPLPLLDPSPWGPRLLGPHI